MRFSKEKRETFNKSFYELLKNSFKNINEKDEKGETILHKAARMSTREKVSFLVKKGADVNARDNKGFTPLHWAVLAKRLENVKVLMEEGAEVNVTEGMTPLHLACMVGAESIIKVLVKAGASVNQSDKFGNAPMYWLLENEKNKKAREFLEKQGGIVRDTPKICDEVVESVGEMVDVWSRRFLPKLKGKVVSLEEIRKRDERGEDGNTVLHLAAYLSDEKVIKLLIEKGAEINIENNNGDRPLHLAAFYGKVENVKVLIEGGANVNAIDDGGYTALHSASLMSCEKTVRELIKAGSNVNTGNYIGRTALHSAVFMREIGNVRAILEAGGNVNARDHKANRSSIYGKD
ncbi:ankyrin repeat domain-containing protein [Wolbachia endosymbiont (group A) of Myopa testacea]|uniref:ankyrin repeat domain-containing protein n=1 Tax=Wolbachia endosymbiont (group A) of Myopa testacea TaxID=3066148 RepID=UPI003340AC0B